MYIYNMSKISLIITLCCAVSFLGSIDFSAQNKDSKTQEKLIRPPYLKAGDTVAIVAPSGILKERTGEVDDAVKLLKSWGLNAVIGKHVFSQANHFAGTDDERCEDFQKALDDPSISLVCSWRLWHGQDFGQTELHKI